MTVFIPRNDVFKDVQLVAGAMKEGRAEPIAWGDIAVLVTSADSTVSGDWTTGICSENAVGFCVSSGVSKLLFLSYLKIFKNNTWFRMNTCI